MQRGGGLRGKRRRDNRRRLSAPSRRGAPAEWRYHAVRSLSNPPP